MKKEILLFGFLNGLFGIGLNYLYYHGSIGAFQSLGFSILFLCIISVVGILTIKKKGDGIISFSDILLFCIAVAIIGVLVNTIANQTYLSLISVEDKQALIDKFVDSQLALYENMGLPIEEGFDEGLVEQVEYSMSLKGLLVTIPMMVFIGGFIGMILGLIFKKDF